MLNLKSNNLPLLAERQNIFNRSAVLTYLLIFESAFLVIALLTNQIVWIFTAGILGVPILLFLLPVEPIVGLTVMVLTTGLDFIGRVSSEGEVGGFNLTYFHLAFVITIISMILHNMYQGKLAIPQFSLWVPLITFNVMLAVGVIWAPDFESAIFSVVRTVFMGLLTLTVVMVINKKWHLSLVFWAFVAVTSAVSVLTVYQLVNEGSIFAPVVNQIAMDLGMPVYRATGTFANPNILASFLMTGLVLSFARVFQKKLTMIEKVFLITCIVITTVGILLSFSRSAWLSCMAGLGLILVYHKKWSYIWYSLILLMIIFFVLLITKPIIIEATFGRFLSIFTPSEDTSSSARFCLIRSSVWMWQDSPLIGQGTDSFRALSGEYQDPQMPMHLKGLIQAHTWPAKIIAENGLIGVIISMWLLMTIEFHGFRHMYLFRDDFLKNMMIGCFALFNAYMVMFLFNMDQYNNSWWITLGLIYIIPMIDKMKQEPNIPAVSHVDDS